MKDDTTVIAELPAEATHYFINLIDANNFLVIDPPVDRKTLARKELAFADVAHKASGPKTAVPRPQQRR
jgi:hypothetical protein